MKKNPARHLIGKPHGATRNCKYRKKYGHYMDALAPLIRTSQHGLP